MSAYRATLPFLLIVLFNVLSIVTRTLSRGYVGVVSRIDRFTFESILYPISATMTLSPSLNVASFFLRSFRDISRSFEA